MTTNSIEENICQAVDIILQRRLSELKFDKMIIGEIVGENKDGSYIILYQDIKTKAFAINGAKYPMNTRVYILTPNNDINQTRFIISSVGKIAGTGEFVTDEVFNETSRNPVQNKVITKKIKEIEEIIKNISPQIFIDDKIDKTSKNPVQNRVIAAELEKLFQSVSDGKQLIASAITDKGVKTEKDASFQIMANNIREISPYKWGIFIEENSLIENFEELNFEDTIFISDYIDLQEV